VDIACRIGSCAADFEDVARRGAKNSFGHVAAAGIAGAKDEDARLGFHHLALSMV
jgi:hypothetical protein